MAPMPPMAPRPDDSEPPKLSADLPDIESILSLNPKKKEHANVLPTAGNDHPTFLCSELFYVRKNWVWTGGKLPFDTQW